MVTLRSQPSEPEPQPIGIATVSVEGVDVAGLREQAREFAARFAGSLRYELGPIDARLLVPRYLHAATHPERWCAEVQILVFDEPAEQPKEVYRACNLCGHPILPGTFRGRWLHTAPSWDADHDAEPTPSV